MKVKEIRSLSRKKRQGSFDMSGLFRKMFFACLFTLVAQTAYSYNFEENGIYYNYLDKDQKTVEVTYGKESMNSYSGDVTIPSTVKSSGTTYTVKSIGEMAFNACSQLNSVVISEGIISLGDEAFRNCYYMTKVTIPESVTSIGKCCFANCSWLTDVAIPESVTSIGEACFYQDYKLKNISIPGSITSLGDEFLYECYSLEEVTIPEGVTSLGKRCFYQCSKLTSITIPENVKTIGNECFSKCNSLSKLIVPQSVTSIGSSCFANCNKLKDVYFLSEDNCTIGLNAFQKDALNAVHVPYGKKSYYSEISALSGQTIKEFYTISVSSAQYGTFYIGAPFTMPEGLKGGVITDVADNGTLAIDYRYMAGTSVPAGTGLLLYTDNADGFSQMVDMNDADGVEAPTDNLLRGSDAAEETTGGDLYYMLSYDAATQSKLGFWWGAENGAAFTNGAHKAYLALKGSNEVKGFSLDDLASGISLIQRDAATVKGIYTIDGRRLQAQDANALPAGIYIVNGKKVAVR